MAAYESIAVPYVPPWAVLRRRRGSAYVVAAASTAPTPDPDVDPPEVTILSPAVGSSITNATPLRVRVTDTAGLRNVILFMGSSDEVGRLVVHDGCCFLPPFTSSTRINIAGGFEFVLRRDGGWKGSPSLSVRAFDVAGNEGQ